MDDTEAFDEDVRSSGSSSDDGDHIRRGFGEFEFDDDEPLPEIIEEDHAGSEEEIQQHCLELFASNDYIMEPEVFDTIKMYFRAGGMPSKVVELLSDNYTACGQTANILAEWMLNLGLDPEEVMSMIENHLQELIVRHFDPKKADAIFFEGGEAPSWLAEMIEHYPWRRLFYRLSEEYPDCLLLNFTIKLISDAGYQQEITSGITAAQQIEIFSQVIRTHLMKLLTEHEDNQEATLKEFLKLSTYGEHTYLFTQIVLDVLSQEAKGGSSVRRIMQEMEKFALSRGYNVIPISICLDAASETHPREAIALASMMSKNALNPADITVLFNAYNSTSAPPVSLIRRPQLLELLVDLLFTGGSKIQAEHKPKYVYLLAYACGVSESFNTKNRLRKTVNKEDVKQISQAIEKAQTICAGNKAAGELVAEIPELYKCIRYAVVAMGVLKWVESVIFELNYFELNPDPVPVHLVLLDEVANIHPLMHSQILNLYIKVFERTFQELDVLIQLNLKRTVLDRMVHLLSRGHVIPTIRFMKKCADEKTADVSLIRHFVSEVIDIIAPPCSEEFLTLFLPLLENEAITGSLRTEKRDDPISVFLANCRKS